ncbi:30S ribosomal protein S15, partial [Dysosmobacter welbionis]
RGIGFCRLLYIVIILQQLFHIREVFCQLCDELLLLAGWRTVIRDDLHPLPCRDVAHVTVCALVTSALDIRTFDDQSCHSSPSSQVSRTR